MNNIDIAHPVCALAEASGDIGNHREEPNSAECTQVVCLQLANAVHDQQETAVWGHIQRTCGEDLLAEVAVKTNATAGDTATSGILNHEPATAPTQGRSNEQHAEKLVPDLDEAQRFLNALTGDYVPVTFQAISEAEGAPTHLCQVIHGLLKQHEERLVRLNEQGALIAVAVNETDGKGRKAANVVRVRAFVLDIDAGSGWPRELIESVKLPPHIVVESSPGKAHLYWRVSDCSLDQFSVMQEALAKAFGGDEKVKDLSRVMRVPGFIHWKGRPFRTRLVSIADIAPYTVAVIRSQLLADEPPLTRPCPPRTIVRPQLIAAPAGLRNVINGVAEGSRDDSIFKYACRLRALGTSKEEARELVILSASRSVPAFPEEEALEKLEQAWKYPEGRSIEPLADAGNAKRLVARYSALMRWVIEFKTWILWKGSHWQLDVADEIVAFAKATASDIYSEAVPVGDTAIAKSIVMHALKTQHLQRLLAMIELAKTEPGISVGQIVLDTDPMLLGVQNGVVDLRSGELCPASPDMFITKRAAVAYDPTAQCPVWIAFLLEVMGGNSALVAYLQRAIGYSLSGSTEEQCLFFLYGTGSNGKTTFLNVLQDVLGQYAVACQAESLMTKRRDTGANNDIARLRGARFVPTVEAEDGKRLAEALIKQMTGGDTVVARFFYSEFFEFRPQFKLWLAANHKPIIRGDDWAIWRRIQLIPFTFTVSESAKDKNLPGKLAAERAGILRWAVEGFLAWRRDGLNPPEDVRHATDAYRIEMDTFGAWLNECCECDLKYETGARELYDSYRQWCDDSETFKLSSMKFSLKLKERGFIHQRTRRGAVYHGVRLVRCV